MNSRKTLFSLIFIFLLIAVPLFLGELLFRAMIFSEASPFKDLKNPSMYAKTNTDDYWKLYYKLGGNFHPPDDPHPLLGWIGYFDRSTLDHWDAKSADNNRKILIYGDSYIMCAHDSIQCFQEILNADTALNKNNTVLNYGVGGYGADQIYLLFANTVDKFEKPFVVFSIMPTDMDRCLLSVRTGQKPYFIEEGDSLRLSGVPIDSVPANFFQENPPNITSYLWRRFINSELNPKYSLIPSDDEVRKKIMQLNKKIILRAHNDIKNRNLEYVFLIFDELWNEEGNWRIDSLQKFMTEKSILFINTGDLVKEDVTFNEYNYANYTIKNDGHPNSHYNKLVCEEIKKCILDYTAYSSKRKSSLSSDREERSIEYYERAIRTDKDWLKSIREKAEAKNIPLDSMIRLDAIWSYEEANRRK